MKKKLKVGGYISPPLKKVLMVMKLTAILVFFLTFQLSASVYSQQAKLSLNMNNMTVRYVLQSIEDQSRFKFLLQDELIDIDKKIDINVKDESINTVLDKIFSGQNIQYVITEKNLIIINPNTNNFEINSSQQKNVSGKVTDSAGMPLLGVSIVIKGKTIGTITDANGNYNLSNVPSDAILQFSFVGMKPQEISISGKNNINITLQEETIGIDEVVAIGYGTQKKASLTSAISSMKTDDISKIPTSNLSNVLQGRMSGVYVQSYAGTPGLASNIRVRFPSSFNSQPVVYVIDDVVRDASAFNALDANEVESISVLKDAASAAIYGSRSAGGVILVTTKKGKMGKPKFDFNASATTERLGPTRKFLSTEESIDIMNMVIPGSVDQDEKKYIIGMNPDGLAWFNALYKKPWNVKGNFSMSGANDFVNYFVGGSLYKSSGFMDHVDYEKYNLRADVDVKISKDLTAGVNISTISENRNQMGFNGDGTLDLYGMWAAMRGGMLLNVPPYINGLPVYGGWVGNVPEIIENGGYMHYPTNHTDVLLHLDYKIPYIKGLTARLTYSNNLVNQYTKYYFKSTTSYQFATTGSHNLIYTDELIGPVINTPPGAREGVYSSNTKTSSYQLNGQLNYTRDFKNHHIDAMLMYEQSEYYRWYVSSERYGFPLYPTDQYFATSGDSNNRNGNGNESLDSRLSYAGRVNYNYNDKYLLSALFRVDGSLKFSPSQRWGAFPSISAGWVVSNEEFFKPATDIVNNLKIRGSFASTGNDNIGGWAWLEQYAISGGYYNGGKYNTGLVYNGMSNPNLTWETSNTFDGGIDMRLFNHATVTADYFYTHTYDILGNRIISVPAEFGASMPAENYGIINAHGFELELGYENKIGSDFSYKVQGTFSYATNKVKKWDVSEGTLPVDNRIGKTMNFQTGYQALGILRTQADLDKLPEGFLIGGAVPSLGMMNFADINGPNRDGKPDGKVDGYDRIVVSKYNGVGSAPYSYGLLINLGWKGITLDAQFAGQGGFTYSREQEWYSGMRLTPVYFKDSWTPENPLNSSFPKIYLAGQPEQISYTATSTFSVQDASFVRLKYLNLGYTIPSSFVKRIGINSLQVYAQATNLFLLTKFKDYDPELSGVTNYPLTKSFTLGLNVKF